MTRRGRYIAATVALPFALMGFSAPAALGAWSIEPTQNQPGMNTNILEAVSCPAAQMCVAVGYAGTTNAESVPSTETALAEHWDGHSWSSYKTIVSPPGRNAELSSVSCTAAYSCLAVGTLTKGPLYNPSSQRPLVERWNGKTWSVIKVPALKRRVMLSGVSCVSASDCVAVGGVSGIHIGGPGGTKEGGLVERYNGRKWTVEAKLKAPFYSDGSFSSVSCITKTSCMAVGTVEIQGPDEAPFAARLNGKKWKVLKAPGAFGARATSFSGVSCASPRACIAVGEQLHDTDGPNLAVAERWNGHKWSVQHLADPNPPENPNEPPFTSQLGGVSCASAHACVAVGQHWPGFGSDQTLVEQWNGQTWSVVPSPNAADAGSSLWGVQCLAGPTCTAVGDYTTQTGTTSTLAEGG